MRVRCIRRRRNLIELPVRTSAASVPGRNPGVLNYGAATTATNYQSLNQESGSTPIETLPGLGSIQLKAAWVPSNLLDGDPNTYHLTEAVYYKDSPSQPNGLCYDVEQFGLIGLHIIQRVHAGAPGGSPDPAGGTYVFATWEHQSIGDGAGYTYVNYSKFATDTELPYPNTALGLPVARLKPYPLPTTAALNLQVQAALTSSVWKNYRLIGTQFRAMDLRNAGAEQLSTAAGQPLYLANLMIETNRGLQRVPGATAGTDTKFQFRQQRSGKKLPVFLPLESNMSFNGKAVNMGGCMGCHGVAQTQGFAFSFVLQDGDKETMPDTSTSIAIPPVAPPTTRSLLTGLRSLLQDSDSDTKSAIPSAFVRPCCDPPLRVTRATLQTMRVILAASHALSAVAGGQRGYGGAQSFQGVGYGGQGGYGGQQGGYGGQQGGYGQSSYRRWPRRPGLP